MISEIIEQERLLKKEGYTKQESLMIILINEIKQLRGELHEFSHKKL